MFVVGRVVDAGRQERDGGLGRCSGRRDRAQRGQQFIGVVLDRRHAVPRKQVRKQPHHDLAVFQHVGDAGRRACIVLQHVEFFRVDPDDIDAGDVHIDVMRHILPVHLGAEHGILVDQVFRDDAGAQDVARMINVAEEQVQRLDALLQAGFEDGPFPGRDDPRDHVERDQPLLRLGVAVDCEGDADPAKQQLGFLAAIFQGVRRGVLEPEREFLIGLTQTAVGLVHLIERNCHRPSDYSPKEPCRETLKVDGSKAMVARRGPARYALIEGHWQGGEMPSATKMSEGLPLAQALCCGAMPADDAGGRRSLDQ